MMDLIYILAILAFFGLCLGLIKFFDSLNSSK